jgi:hypothetical protein
MSSIRWLDPVLQLLHHQADEELTCGSQISGTLPILYVFLARSGKTLKSVTPVTLDADGNVKTENAGPNRLPRGARITFTGPDGVEKTLYYFSTDLLKRRRQVERLPEVLLDARARQQPDQERVLSAPLRQFHDARLFARQQRHIIQDDPGIPLQYYNNKQWRFFPFGRYNGPIGEFPGRYQQSYAELFRKAEPINFGIGYRWRTNDSNVPVGAAAE